MKLQDALKWADVFGPIQSEPPDGNSPALVTLAAEVRRLERELAEANNQARLGWARHAEKDAAYGQAMGELEELRDWARATRLNCGVFSEPPKGTM